ncbi:dehydrogenase/reductase SDR family member 4-like isoform X1 [Takifugu flavidus]|nr:dehydrogenase/reductase SDR family member 4-like isoform X1 [Takifugu flavidus]XP_056882922.1 dehydrogenase/reductase SDR family member 4-like isoform X1 [Takifugu flavidus]XP_056882923.1 dehydrogenase/reductase SDR family member 4-like isoform X1 [Takifugu flavidus]XP_056882926.1 dehydrogenase/reductase SDR family member 4-like isoform X1 [Takifugu flavidus]XP_056882927.1 dehydrogenase/reductase SDR family member 4-like isoform X1 [Takifugu flavidus]XP_056882930.1 dehydrogenase/reductase S
MLRSIFRCLSPNLVAGQRRMSQSSLNGKVAIVTASTDGIGLATALALGMRGAHVVVSSRRQANVDKAVALLRTHNIQVTGTTCNVGKGEDREKLIQMTLDQCGGIDILVSNAAVKPFFGNILDSTEDDWDKILSVNVKSAFLLTKLVVPHMEKRGGGNIVFVSSVTAYQPIQGLGPYCVSKTALLDLSRVLAPELAQSNIRVNCVAPGDIKTRFSAILWKNEAIMDEFKNQPSIKRIGQVEEIGGVVAFLCSEEASYITGETITASGGGAANSEPLNITEVFSDLPWFRFRSNYKCRN